MIGNVQGKDVIIVNDIIDNGTVFSRASEVLKKNGANSIYGYATHGLLSENCIDLINKSEIKSMTVTDSINVKINNNEKFEVLTLAPILSEVIYRLSTRQSLSGLFSKF